MVYILGIRQTNNTPINYQIDTFDTDIMICLSVLSNGSRWLTKLALSHNMSKGL